MSTIGFRILGPLDVLVDGHAVQPHGLKSKIVLSCLLIAKGRHASIPHLTDAVWGELPPATAIKQIRNTVSDLRRMLTPYGVSITAQSNGYCLVMDNSSFDLETFQDHLATARQLLEAEQSEAAIAEFRSALNLWRGPVLAGIDSDKLRPSIAELNEMRLSAAEEYFGLQLSLNRHQVVAAEVAAWAEEYPLRERLVAQYVSALHRSGARAQALDAYERSRRQLDEGLGISPGPVLARAYQEILDEDARSLVPAARNHPVLTSAPGNLPGPVAHFTGRSAELKTLAAAQRSARGSPLLVIDGMAGVGKTALATSLAHELSDQYPDGQLWVAVNGHDSGSPLADLTASLRHLLAVLTGGKASLPQTLEDLVLLWQRHTADRRLLTVLDDVGAAEQLLALRPAGRTCLTIATSRRRLRLVSQPPAYSLSLGCLEPEDSKRLLSRLIGGDRSADSAAALDTIRKNCGDLPLAICAAAARLRSRPTWTPEYLAERLSNPALRLHELQTDQGDLASYFGASQLRLRPEQQRMLRLLAQAPVRRVNAEFGAELSGLPLLTTDLILEELVDEHLVLQPQPGAYELHPLMQSYCSLKQL